ncbi:MAG: hypothetical protein ACLRI7_11635, partial [Ruthenibacterium lactatiformans]
IVNQNTLFHCKSSFDYSGKRKANPRNLGLALDENIQVCCTGSVSCCGRCVIHHFVSSTPFLHHFLMRLYAAYIDLYIFEGEKSRIIMPFCGVSWIYMEISKKGT